MFASRLGKAVDPGSGLATAFVMLSVKLSRYVFEKFNYFAVCPADRVEILYQSTEFRNRHFFHAPLPAFFYLPFGRAVGAFFGLFVKLFSVEIFSQ